MIEALLIWYFGMGMMVAGYHLEFCIKPISQISFRDLVISTVLVAIVWPAYLSFLHRLKATP